MWSSVCRNSLSLAHIFIMQITHVGAKNNEKILFAFVHSCNRFASQGDFAIILKHWFQSFLVCIGADVSSFRYWKILGLKRVLDVKFCLPIAASGQVSVWQSATLLPISCNSVQPVPTWVEEPVSPVRQSSSDGPRTIHPFPRCPKAALESRLSKLVVYYWCVFRHRRRTRTIISASDFRWLKTLCYSAFGSFSLALMWADFERSELSVSYRY